MKGSTTADVGQRERLTKGDIAGILWLRRDWQRESGSLVQLSVSHDSVTLWGVNDRSQIFTKQLAGSQCRVSAERCATFCRAE